MTDRHELRNKDGRFTEDPDLPARDAHIADLRRQGLSPLQISRQEGIPRTTVYQALERAYAAVRAVPAAEARQLEVERLEAIIERLHRDEQDIRQLMGGDHVTVSQGRVVVGEDGDPVPDHAFALQCYDRIHRIEQRRLDVSARLARLLGLEAPVKQEIAGGVKYEILGIDPTKLT